MILVNYRDKIDWFEGMTIIDVFKAMGYDYALITVTVNGEFVPRDDYSSYQIPDEADVKVFHLAHGG